MNYSIDTIMRENINKYGDKGYIYEKENGVYCGHTYREFCEDVWRHSDHLNKNGFGRVIALYAANSYKYMVLDTAIMGYIGICMTLSKEWTCDDIDRMLETKKIDSLIYDKERAEAAEKLSAKYPAIKFVSMDEIKPESEYTILPAQDRNASCKVIFSSGTTGIPKGVMLCQRNMFASWDNLYKRAPMNETDVDYLFLSLNHTYAGICNFLYSVISGMQIWLCSDTKKIFEEILEVKPTLFCAVPLIYERLYAVCMEKGLDPVQLLGGNIRYLFCGGAYMKPEIRQYIKQCGLNFMEAYGLSETSSLISTEYSYSRDDFTSCGAIYEHLDARIADDGEIIVKGDNVFNGYYQEEELTKKCFTEDGYFKTGDTGEIRDGKLYLIGRKKRVIILSNGENVYPHDIEKCFEGIENIAKVKVFEKNREIFATLYVTGTTDAERIISSVNETLPKYSRISAYEVLHDSIAKRIK